MYCEQCGEQIYEGAAFCGKCGAKAKPSSEMSMPTVDEANDYKQCPFCETRVSATANVCTGCQAFRSNPWAEGEKGKVSGILIAVWMLLGIPVAFVVGIKNDSTGVGVTTYAVPIFALMAVAIINYFMHKNDRTHWYRYKR